MMSGNILGASYDIAKGVTQAVDTPFLSFAALAPQAWNTFTGDKQAVANGKENGYNFGDFFGTAKPFMSGFDATKPITDSASWLPIADAAGTAFEAASWAAGAGPEVAAGVDATKAAGPLTKLATGIAKSSTAQFSIAQGAGQGFHSLGQGNSPSSAVGTGVISGLASAATMKVLDLVGGSLASGSFWKNALRTQARSRRMLCVSRPGSYSQRSLAM